VTGAEEYDVVGLESGEDVGLQVVVDGGIKRTYFFDRPNQDDYYNNHTFML